jgi:hypothetical protein
MFSQFYRVHSSKLFKGYGDYFYDVVEEFAALEPYESTITLSRKPRGLTTQIMLRSNDAPTLRGLCQCIDAEISVAPFQYSLLVPEKYIGEEGYIGNETGVFSRLEELKPEVDYQVCLAEGDNVTIVFNRAFHLAKIERGLKESRLNEQQGMAESPYTESAFAEKLVSLEMVRRAKKLFSESPGRQYENFRPPMSGTTILQLQRPR